ncbi:hypothetical protein UlMin_040698, partial [Ulmus minor]
MALRSTDRKFSFEILSGSSSLEDDDSLLHRSNSDPIHNNNHQEHHQSNPKEKLNRKKRKKKKKKKSTECSIPEEPIAEKGVDFDSVSDNSKSAIVFPENRESCGENGLELNRKGFRVANVVCDESRGSVCTVTTVTEPGFQNVRAEVFNYGELRQRSVNGSGGGDGVLEDLASRVCSDGKEESGVEVSSGVKQSGEMNGSVITKLETAESLDWKRLMSEDPNYMLSADNSPLKYFMEEMFNGSSLRSTTTHSNEIERERVYDTIFRLPWRCELLIDVGFFVCFDSFLSLLTIMPARILMTFRRLFKTRQFKGTSTAELSDFGCFIIMACGVTLLERTDISLIYHMIRGQGTVKLYVVYNILE